MGRTTLPTEPPRTPMLRAALSTLYGMAVQPAHAIARIQQHTLPEPPKFVPATLTAGPRGSMGEEVPPQRIWTVTLLAGTGLAQFGYWSGGQLHVIAERFCPQPTKCNQLGVCQGKC